MEMAGVETKISAMTPSMGLLGPVSSASLPQMAVCTRAARRATLLVASLPKEPSGPWGFPAFAAALARSPVHLAVSAMMCKRAMS